MQGEEPLEDDLRCKRTDGRQWRCNRRVMDGKKLCELHHLQGRHRQVREKVPESLKMVRKNRRMPNVESVGEINGETRAQRASSRLVRLAKSVKRKRVIGESEALDEAVRKMKLKRGDLQLELIRMVLKREVEKRKKLKGKKKKKKKKQSNSNEDGDGCEEELTRVLPNGVMAISSSSPHFGNAGSSCDIKIGAEPVAVRRRCFRSKNIEPSPVGTLQVVPFKGNAMGLKRGKKRCHWCGKKSFKNLISCSNCGQHFFCIDCTKEQHFHTQEEIKITCPVCRGTCGCKSCTVIKCGGTENKNLLGDKSKVDRVLHLHYLICMLLPVLKQINQDRSVELEMEAKIKGQKPCKGQILTVEFRCNKQHCCNCKTSILDLHRSCQNCSYNLCLSCCRDIFQKSLCGITGALDCKSPNRRNGCRPMLLCLEKQSMSTSNHGQESTYVSSSASLTSLRVPDGDASISCPPKEFGGCGDGLLALGCVFPSSWTEKLEISAEEIVGSYELPEALDTSSSCSLCFGMDNEADGIKQLREAANRENSNDNFLYYPTILDMRNDNVEHFQKHWSQGHPVIVQNVLRCSPNLSWDPITMFCTYLKNNAKSQNDETHKADSCLDWFEVEIGINQLFLGSLRGHTETNMCHEKLKLKGWISSRLFQEQFPAHYAEIINALPLPDYMDPKSGLLNIAARLPEEIPKPDLGPWIYISYVSGDELVQADSVTKLSFYFFDMVNILAHTTDAPASTRQICNIRKLMEEKKAHAQEYTKIAPGQEMTNQVKRSSVSNGEGENIELHNMVRNEMNTWDMVTGASHLLAATNGACELNHKDRDAPHMRESESETDTDYDSEASGPSPRTIQHSKRSEDKEFYLHRTASSNIRQENLAESCGAQWDVFRRQDVPKLLEYLRKHSYEFSHSYGFQKHVVHPILDKNFFLDTTHKMKLKEEFEIEPWTFEQHVGEAVIIPAGCPYQIRKLKSCVNIVLDFASPENATECIQLTDELRLLPEDHRAKSDKFQVKKMALHNIDAAIKEIRELTRAD
ncbi:lysine-specific demethylase JMJ25 isoform X2 [Carica papaya]|uniref:lysine-specific demethylase JMJ25 isoform X2 n=1 Tax=Carica papaya TaxID=3649 RepID=UPI000B8C9392|nr:lysine-specific demethylase JMJ25 isoform X2 [Carica papaya]